MKLVLTHVWVHENLLRNYQKSHKNHKMFNFCLFESSDIFKKIPVYPFLPMTEWRWGSRRRLLLSWFNTGSGTNMTNWKGVILLMGPWNPIPNHPGWCWNPINNGKILLRLVVFPVIYKVLYIPGGAGFQPSTVGAFFNTHFGGDQRSSKYIYILYISQSGRKESPPETRCFCSFEGFPDLIVHEVWVGNMTPVEFPRNPVTLWRSHTSTPSRISCA